MSRDATNLRHLSTVAAARELARRRLPAPVFDYVDGAAGGEVTAAANRSALEAVRFVPRFGSVAAAQGRDLSTTVLGTDLAFPVIIGPVGFTRSMHPGGDAAGLAAATAAGTVFVHSSMSGHAIEEIADPASPHYWFQLYFLGGREGAEQLVDRAANVGARTLVVTVDTPTPGNRERDLRYGASLPIRLNRRTITKMAPLVAGHPRWLYQAARDHFTLHLGNAVGLTRANRPISEDESLLHWIVEPPTWEDVAWIRERWTGSLVIKGVLSGDDARRAVDCGADAIVVSNHGGRQLDQSPATLPALRAVVSAVGDATTVLMDGGIRRGSDVAIALCCGARAVLIGRAWAYGLAAAGEPGVSRVLELLRADLSRTMQLLGVRTVAELTGEFVDVGPPW